MFNKIKKLLEKIFKKQKMLDEPIRESKEVNINKDFREELIKNSNIEILNLQKQYENGEILEENLPIYKINKLIELYKEQIKQLDSKINIKKAKIQ